MTYKDAIKKIRKKLIMTQIEFADLLGVSFSTMNRWEQGQFLTTFKAKRKLVPLFQKYQIEVDE